MGSLLSSFRSPTNARGPRLRCNPNYAASSGAWAL